MTAPKFHAFCYCTIGSREEIEQGMAGQDGELYQRMLNNLAEYVTQTPEARAYAQMKKVVRHLADDALRSDAYRI